MSESGAWETMRLSKDFLLTAGRMTNETKFIGRVLNLKESDKTELIRENPVEVLQWLRRQAMNNGHDHNVIKALLCRGWYMTEDEKIMYYFTYLNGPGDERIINPMFVNVEVEI